MSRKKGPACHHCGGTGVEPAMNVPRCMSCSQAIKTLEESELECPNGAGTGIGGHRVRGKHTMSIGDLIRLGYKFSKKELRENLGPEWEKLVEEAEAR